jgi:protein gp37
MGSKTAIEWTDSTWNPLRGCSRVSEGCRNCYAEKVAGRFSGAGLPYEGLARMVNGHAQWTGKVDLVEKHLDDPLKWKEPRRIFVNSMSDLFHPSVSDEWIDSIFSVMARCPQHTFQVLTKRPSRMLRYLSGAEMSIRDDIKYEQAAETMRWPLPNVWLGVSVENQKAADERIPLLLQTPAAVRFASCEPLLEAVRLDRIGEEPEGYLNAMAAVVHCDGRGTKSITGIDWVICGGESGPDARPIHPDWARGLRDQCKAVGTPFFFKQWGEWGPSKMQHIHSQEKAGHLVPMTTICSSPKSEVGKVSYWAYPSVVAKGNWGLVERMERVGKKAAGSLLDGVEHKAFPEVRG